MFKNCVTFCFLLFTLILTGQNQTCEIKTKGLYVADLGNGTKIFIKFINQDELVTTSSDMSIEQAFEFITKSNRDIILSGTFKVKNCIIYLKAKGETGKVKMEGIVAGSNLALAVSNLNDNTYQDFIFKFYPQ